MTKQPTRLVHLAKEFFAMNAALLIAATLLFGSYVLVRNVIGLIIK